MYQDPTTLLRRRSTTVVPGSETTERGRIEVPTRNGRPKRGVPRSPAHSNASCDDPQRTGDRRPTQTIYLLKSASKFPTHTRTFQGARQQIFDLLVLSTVTLNKTRVFGFLVPSFITFGTRLKLPVSWSVRIQGPRPLLSTGSSPCLSL